MKSREFSKLNLSEAAKPGRIFLALAIAFLMIMFVNAAPPAGKDIRVYDNLKIMNIKKLSATYDMNVKSYQDPDQKLTPYKSFAFDYTNKENPLLEKELLKMVETELVQKGLTRSEDNPDLLITMSFYVGKKEQYTPPQTVTTTRIENHWQTGMVGYTVTGHNVAVPVTESQTTAGHTEVSYYRNIHLNFLDYGKIKGGEKLEIPPLVWIGEVDSEGSKNDIREVAPYLLKQLLGEFPSKTGLKGHREYTCATYGDIGLELTSPNWGLINYVAKGSPADLAGIKAGEIIETINGAKPIGGIFDDENNIKIWAANFIYENILKNPGNREVELKIKDPASKKTRSVKVTPIVSEHCQVQEKD